MFKKLLTQKMRGAKIGVSKICDTSCRLHIEAKGQWRQDGFIDLFCYGIGNCSYSSGTPARIALAILGVQSAGFALFYGIGKSSYSRGISTRIALAILGVQSAGFALFYTISTMNISKETEK